LWLIHPILSIGYNAQFMQLVPDNLLTQKVSCC
jgi:hypothetical protein